MSKVHWQTIYCKKFTVDETGHFAWACLEKMTPRSCQVLCSKNTLKVHETWLAIYCSYIFLIKGHLCIICAVMDDETARKPVYHSKSPSWPGMCISIDLSFIKQQTPSCAIVVPMF